jgi:hypothetical protein
MAAEAAEAAKAAAEEAARQSLLKAHGMPVTVIESPDLT